MLYEVITISEGGRIPMKELKEKVKGFLCLPITEATEKKVGEVGKLSYNFV